MLLMQNTQYISFQIAQFTVNGDSLDQSGLLTGITHRPTLKLRTHPG